MSNSKEVSTSSGIGVGGLLLVLFIALKLIGIQPVADWSWWWVMAPMWLPLVVVLGVMGIVVTVVIACKS